MTEETTLQGDADAEQKAAPTKQERAHALYTAWRNEYLREIPTALFNRIDADAVHLVAAIAAEL